MDLVIVAVVAVGTFALRSSFIVFAGERRLPAAVEGILENVKPAAMAAIATAAMAARETLEPVHLIALAIATLAAWKGVDLLLVIALGMVTLTLGRALT